jgi:hypothetical protein
VRFIPIIQFKKEIMKSFLLQGGAIVLLLSSLCVAALTGYYASNRSKYVAYMTKHGRDAPSTFRLLAAGFGLSTAGLVAAFVFWGKAHPVTALAAAPTSSTGQASLSVLSADGATSAAVERMVARLASNAQVAILPTRQNNILTLSTAGESLASMSFQYDEADKITASSMSFLMQTPKLGHESAKTNADAINFIQSAYTGLMNPEVKAALNKLVMRNAEFKADAPVAEFTEHFAVMAKLSGATKGMVTFSIMPKP